MGDFNARRFTELSVCRSYQTSFDGCSGDWGNIELGTVTYRHDDGSESKARDLTVAPSSHYLNWDLDRLVNNTGKMGNYGKDGMRSFSNKTYYLNEYLLANSTYRGFCMDAVTDMCYYVFHGPDGSIQKTVVDITVSNVSMATAPSATYVRQEYQLEFVPTHGPRKASSDEAGNTSLHYEFLYAYVGSTQSPQAKIVGARAYYGYEDIVFSSELGTQHIMITTTVSFTLLGQNGYEKYTPGVPPVLW